MKNSEIYDVAMAAVIRDDCVCMVDKLEVLSVLMDDQKRARWCEEREAKNESTG